MPYEVQSSPGLLGTLAGLAGAGFRVQQQLQAEKTQREQEEQRQKESAAQLALQQAQFGLEQQKEKQAEALAPGEKTLQGLQIKAQQFATTPLDLTKMPKALQAGPPQDVAGQYAYYNKLSDWLSSQPGQQAADYATRVDQRLRTMEMLYGTELREAGATKREGMKGQAARDVANIRGKYQVNAAQIRSAGSVQAAGIRAAAGIGYNRVPYSGAELDLWNKAASAMAQPGVNPIAIAATMSKQTGNRALQNDLQKLAQQLVTQQTTPQGRILNPQPTPTPK